MPEILPVIAAIVGIAGTGVSLGESLANQPGTPKPPAAPTVAQTTPEATATADAQKAAIAQQFPNIQAQTGGTLSPDAFLQLAQLSSGQAGQPGVSGTNVDLIQKLLTGATGGVFAGGGAGSSPVPGSPGLANTTFG